jgi:hypothetical protein
VDTLITVPFVTVGPPLPTAKQDGTVQATPLSNGGCEVAEVADLLTTGAESGVQVIPEDA